MKSISVDRAAEIIVSVSDRLAELLLELEGEPIDPDAVELDLLHDTRAFAAYVGPHPDRDGAALVKISPYVVIEIVEALRRAGWNFAEEEAGAEFVEGGIEPILELALQWVILHELAHWGLGHLGYREAVSGAKGARLSCTDNSFAVAADDLASNPDAARSGRPWSDLSPEEYRCLELQADFQATLLLDVLHDEPDAETSGAADDAIRLPASRQLVALAAGIAIILVQRQRPKKDAGEPDLRHPSPEARAFNVMSVLLAQSVRHLGQVDEGGIRLATSDDEQVRRIREAWVDALRVFYRYLAPFAEAVGVQPIFSNPSLVRARMEGAADDLVPLTGREVLVFLLEPGARPDRFETPGGRELSALRGYNLELQRKAAPYAAWPL